MADVSDPAQYWDRHAATFDDKPDHGLRDPAVRSAWASLLRSVLPQPPSRIADVGCGTGTLAVLLSAWGHRVSGIDLSPRMVEQAREKAAVAGVDAGFVVADAMAPPWPRATFDVVLARHVLWTLPDAGSALGRWIELLTPPGRLILIEGRCLTGEGLAAADALALLRGCDRDAAVKPLDDPALWGGPINDERYLLVSPAK